MNPAFYSAAGQVIGWLAGTGLLVLFFWIGLSWGRIRRDVSSTKQGVQRIEPIVGEHARALQSITQTLHGPEGGNGLYSVVRKIDERLDAVERRRTPRNGYQADGDG